MHSVDKHMGVRAHEVGFTAFSTAGTGSLLIVLMRLRLDPAGCILALDLEVCMGPRHAHLASWCQLMQALLHEVYLCHSLRCSLATVAAACS